MSPDTIANILNAADNLGRLRFSAAQFENKSPELRCLILNLPGITKKDHESLAEELNEAIAPVIKRRCGTLMNIAANQLRPYL